jgi:hypothetical protein
MSIDSLTFIQAFEVSRVCTLLIFIFLSSIWAAWACACVSVDLERSQV